MIENMDDLTDVLEDVAKKAQRDEPTVIPGKCFKVLRHKITDNVHTGVVRGFAMIEVTPRNPRFFVPFLKEEPRLTAVEVVTK